MPFNIRFLFLEYYVSYVVPGMQNFIAIVTGNQSELHNWNFLPTLRTLVTIGF